MKIALASPPFPGSISDGLVQIEKLVKEAAAQQAAIICFPESYIPGYPAAEFEVEKSTPEKLQICFAKSLCYCKRKFHRNHFADGLVY